MRIHQLTFQAIGPYATAQDLVFDQLDDAGLFLLDGPTGAGKSTILDVLTFALYGKADDERKNTELHSTLAAPGTPPTIRLEVSFGARRFIIDRTLQHFAPRRGATDPTDVVTRQASMSLVECVAGEHRQLTTRVDEAQQLLRGIIGLTREQFTSVVLLPQGDFARFLKASSNDRETILRQLFNTHRFDEIGDYLVAQAKSLRGSVEADAEQRATLRAGIIATAQTPRVSSDTESASGSQEELDALEDTALLDYVDGLMTRWETDAQHRITAATTALTTARDQVQLLQRQQEHLAEASQYRQRLTAHTARTPAVEAATQAVAHHRRATAVVAAQRHCDTAREQLDDALTQVQHGCDAARQDPIIVEWAQDRDIFSATQASVHELVDGWKTVEAAAIRAVDRLTQHEATHASIMTGQQRLRQLTADQERLTARIVTLHEHYDAVSAQLATDTTRTEALAGAEQRVTTATQHLKDAESKQSAAQAAAQAQTAADAAAATATTAGVAADDALAAAQELMRRRIEAAAGFLAAKLEPGTPCEVCGSKTHPQPAAAHDLTEISNDAVQQAEQRATTARRTANEAEATAAAKLRTLQQLQTQAGGLSVPDADAAVVTSTAAVAAATAELETLTELRARITRHQTDAEQCRTDITAAEQQRTECATQLITVQRDVDTAQAELAAALGEFETVEALRAAVEPAHRHVGQLVAHTGVLATAVATHAIAQQRVAEALEASATDEHDAFRDAAQAQEYVLDAAVEAEHDALVHQWTTEAARLSEKAGQAAVVAGLALLDDRVTAPSQEVLAAATAAQRTAETQLSAVNREHGTLQATARQYRTQQAQLIELTERAAEQLATYEELTGLSDVVAGRGENSVTMPLRSFVLAGWLEQVAANASERLTGMTGGRYELQHAVGQGGRGYAGLNLQVIDHLNDTTRTPSTLSGGETFMASLALALGLADAVQAQAGGVAMDTLFIDEGFGSLDADTLEEVMEVLAALQDDGRLIGLVSHVESMKQQIPHRIQVTKSPTGSSVRIMGPDIA